MSVRGKSSIISLELLTDIHPVAKGHKLKLLCIKGSQLKKSGSHDSIPRMMISGEILCDCSFTHSSSTGKSYNILHSGLIRHVSAKCENSVFPHM